MAADFQVFAHLNHVWKAGEGEDSMRIGGIVSTADLDKQDEEVVQTGLDFTEFVTDGWYNDNHAQHTAGVLGYPSQAKYVRKGERLPDGSRARQSGWWTEGYLLDTEKGREVFELCRALSGSPRKLGFSIEGRVLKRDPTNPKRITRATVRNVAITHCPVNTRTHMVALAKALTAGSSVANPGAAPGEGFPLRAESLDKGPNELPYSNVGSSDNDWEAGVDEAKVDRLASGDGDDPNDGGWAGLDPHQTPVRSPKEGTPPRQREIIKAAVARDFKIADETDLLDEWGAALQRNMREIAHSATLTKAEAQIMVSARLPHLSAAEIDDLIERATTY